MCINYCFVVQYICLEMLQWKNNGRWPILFKIKLRLYIKQPRYPRRHYYQWKYETCSSIINKMCMNSESTYICFLFMMIFPNKSIKCLFFHQTDTNNRMNKHNLWSPERISELFSSVLKQSYGKGNV